MSILDLLPSQTGIIVSLGGAPEFQVRLIEMGFRAGIKVRLVQKMPFQGPVQLRIQNGMISLRYDDASKIKVEIQE